MIRRDYQPGEGPVRGLVHACLPAILACAVAAAVAILVIRSCALPPGQGGGW